MASQRPRSITNLPIARRLVSDSRYLNRFFFMMLGLILFITPALISGGQTLYDVFISPDGYQMPAAGEDGSTPWGQVIEDMAWRITVIGIVFCIGWGIILAATRGYPDLEYVLVGISFLLIVAAAGIAAAMTNKCYDMRCEDFKFYAGEVSIIGITILAFVISAGVGKPVGWLSLVFLPVLVYQTFAWIPYLLSNNQHERVMDGVVKATTLLFTVLVMAVLLAAAGGWAGRNKGSPA